MTDVKRLGKRGSYRLGRLRAQGLAAAPPPLPLRPSFSRPRHRGPTSLWLLAAVAGAAMIAVGAVAGLWFMPFAAGLLAGLANRMGGWRARVLASTVAAMALAGWAIPLYWTAWPWDSAGAAARVTAALGGWPANAWAGVVVTLLIAAVQALAGLWLGRALTPRPVGHGPGVPLSDRLHLGEFRRRLGELAAASPGRSRSTR